MKDKQKYLIVFISSFFLLVIFSYFFSDFTGDEIWSYGFSYNISKGLLPYKDFNMVIGPLYNIIIALFIFPFDNNLIAFHITNSMIISIYTVFIYKKLGRQYLYILFLIFLLPNMFSYNTFVAFLTIGILLLEDSSIKHKDIFIGITIGSILITKQNVGLILLLVGLFNSNNKYKTLAGILFLVFSLLIYLIYCGSIFEYINFCFLGLGGFLDNLLIESTAFILYMIILVFLIYQYIVKKDKLVLYLLGFLIIGFPILDNTHVLVSAIPVLYYFLLKSNNKNARLLLKTILIVCTVCFPFKNMPFHFVSNGSFLKYRHINNYNMNTYLNEMTNYVKEKEKNSDVYLFIENAYLIRLNIGQNPGFYDLINKGNLGNNPYKYITSIEKNCKDKTCLFILDSKYFNRKTNSQLSPIFKNFVTKNYQYFETLPSFDRVYKN